MKKLLRQMMQELYISSLIPEIEKFLRADLQHLAKLENNIQRDAYVSKLDGTYMAAVNIHKFG